MSAYLPLLLGIALLLGLSFFFSGAETALMSLSRAQRRRLEHGRSRERAVWRLLQNPPRVLATILLGNLFVNTLLTALTAALLHRLFFGSADWNGRLLRPALEACGLRLGDTAWPRLYHIFAVLLNIAVVTPVLILLGELTPKLTAYRNSLSFARSAARPLAAFGHLVAPILWLLQLLANAARKLLRIAPDARGWDMLTAAEVAAELDAGAATGAASPAEHELLERILRFGTIEAREIMIPRTQIIALDDRLTLREAFASARQATVNHIPVYHGDIDEIWGVLPFRKVLAWRNSPDLDRPLSQYRNALENGVNPDHLPLDPIFFVPATAKIDRLLADMKANSSRMDVVVSEYGGTLGLLTRSMILEEIVGRYACSGRDFNILRKLPGGGFLADGRARLRALDEQLDTEIESDTETLAGFVMEALGRIPAAGDAFDAHGFHFRVLRTSGRIASAVAITPA